MTSGPRQGLTAALLDRMVYGPIGLAFEARRLLPELADRGRRQVELSRRIGKTTVDAFLRRAGAGLEEAMNGFARSTGSPARPVRPPAVRPPPAEGARPTPDRLAIPEYDGLAASQVVPRLGGLSADERAAVRDYELATRGRRTILTALARLEE